jgi:hypothetical protein
MHTVVNQISSLVKSKNASDQSYTILYVTILTVVDQTCTTMDVINIFVFNVYVYLRHASIVKQ